MTDLAAKKVKEKPVPLTESALDERLRIKYPAPEYAYFSGVRNAVGYVRRARTVDGMAISLWPSRGIELIGFEIKCSRSDWLREKRDPAKADAVAKYCDRWYLVVGDAAIVQPGELPAAWGLIVAVPQGLRVVTEAPAVESKPWDRLFLASLLRSISEGYVHRSEIDAEVAKAKKDEQARRQYEFARLKESVEAFEKASGVSIANSWDAGQIGEAVKLIRDHGVNYHVQALKRLRDNAKVIMESVDYALSKEGMSGEQKGDGVRQPVRGGEAGRPKGAPASQDQTQVQGEAGTSEAPRSQVGADVERGAQGCP